MKIYYDLDLERFDAWGGAKSILDELTHGEICKLETIMEDFFCQDDDVSETAINDFLWFETDTIARWLGYSDWESLERAHKYGDEVTVCITNIGWDIDEDDPDEPDPDVPVEIHHTFDYNGDNDELEDDISEWLSDEYGYCHNGFEFKIEEE